MTPNPPPTPTAPADAGTPPDVVVPLARTSLLAFRAFDSYWSEQVQRRQLPYDPELVRHVHGVYAWWMRTFGDRLPKDDPDVMQVRGFLSFDVEDLIRSMAEMERGEVTPLEDVI